MSYQIIAEKPIGEVITDQGAYMQMKLMHIVCDTVSQMPDPLPAWATGSRCDVLADFGTVYILSVSREWKKVNFYNQGGSGGGLDPDDYYTKPQTDSRITEKVAEIVADAPEDFDTLKEMSDWIEDHEDSAAAMNTAIQQNTTALAGKVDKVSGKGLSTNDFTTDEKTKLAGLENYDDSRIVADISALQTSVSGKVDAVSGMGLSQNSFTDAEKTKLEGIETGANKITVDSSLDSASSNPVQNQAVYTALNSKVDMVTGKQLSTEDYTTAEKTKLAGLTVSKNLIPTVINSPLTQDGITLTLNSDYSINANGTATNTTRVYTGERTLPAGRYELNGCPYTKNSNYSVELYRYDTESEQWVLYYDDPASIIRNGSSFIFTAEIETKVRTAICFNQGCTVSNVTFQIMIRDYDAYMLDDNYEPYAPSNFELYSLIGNINNVLEGVL